MTDPVQMKQSDRVQIVAPIPYDKRNLSYAGTFTNPGKAFAIRGLEWITGKIPLLRLVRRFERIGPAFGQAFWAQALGLAAQKWYTLFKWLCSLPVLLRYSKQSALVRLVLGCQ